MRRTLEQCKIPSSIIDIIERAMQLREADRYASIYEIRAALESAKNKSR